MVWLLSTSCKFWNSTPRPGLLRDAILVPDVQGLADLRLPNEVVGDPELECVHAEGREDPEMFFFYLTVPAQRISTKLSFSYLSGVAPLMGYGQYL